LINIFVKIDDDLYKQRVQAEVALFRTLLKESYLLSIV